MQARVFEYLKIAARPPQILIVSNDKDAIKCGAAAEFAGFEPYILPDFRAVFGDDLRPFLEELTSISRELTNFHASTNPKKIIISPLRTILHRLPTASQLKTVTLKNGDKIGDIKEILLNLGYSFVDVVEAAAEARVSGEVIDIFGITDDEPTRILLDCDIIESIRHFDIVSQKSNPKELPAITIAPFLANLAADKSEELAQRTASFDPDALLGDLNSFGFWCIDGFCDYLEGYEAAFCEAFDYAEMVEFFLSADNIAGDSSVGNGKNATSDSAKSDFTASDSAKTAPANSHAAQIAALNKKLSQIPILPAPKTYRDLQITPNDGFFSLNADKKISVLTTSESAFAALGVRKTENINIIKSPLILNIASSDELIISLNRPAAKRQKRRATLAVGELKAGDLVVHEDYGIGRFLGLELLTVLGRSSEFVAIAYQNGDKLLLPTTNLALIDRYIASSGSIPVLDRLGKASFAKLKERVKEKLFIIASKIVALAAKRELIAAPKIPSTADLAAFRASAGFLYTADQQRATEAIEEHLASGRVMDMLLSGDVGFGKTEVAMNAIFSAIQAGFSALFFVPTTLLCSQHFKTLNERFAPYNIDVRRLDRFTTAREKSAITAKLKNGEPLVVIGTHALLSLTAANLGLIIIDEEHKFGVKQKEKLKEISTHAHLLSMSATPIPRSLNMALSKVKSYATLTTPPLDRQPIRTFVKKYDGKLIKEAILRELRRGGQIFFVHNLIADMPRIEKELKKLIPQIRILTLHGQIDAAVSEDEMMRFASGGYDLLLCTSIVESGIHLPNANTIIVDAADRFGIADLHQLRGRVGRGPKQGYCYFLVSSDSSITEDATKRLLALESNSYLGSGAVLAYHDLEIRGGGNLIGEAQSGHIEQIGYSLYLKMLEDQINALLSGGEGEAAVSKSVDIKLAINAFLSPDLISEDSLRLEIYRRLSHCQSPAAAYEIGSEIEDRFGRLDTPTKQFIDLIAIKVLAAKADIKAITNYEQNITLTKKTGDRLTIKSPSRDEDDIIAALLTHLRKQNDKHD